MNRFRPCLKNEKLACDAVLRPFNVHRLRMAGNLGIMLLNQARPSGQGQNLVVAQTIPRSVRCKCRFTACRPRPLCIHQPDFLRSESSPDNWTAAVRQCWLEDKPFIRRNNTLYDELAQAVSAGYGYNIAKS